MNYRQSGTVKQSNKSQPNKYLLKADDLHFSSENSYFNKISTENNQISNHPTTKLATGISIQQFEVFKDEIKLSQISDQNLEVSSLALEKLLQYWNCIQRRR